MNHYDHIAQQQQAQLAAQQEAQFIARLERAMLSALTTHTAMRDAQLANQRAVDKLEAKDIRPTNGGTSGQQLVTANNGEGNEVTVLQTEYDARPYEGCEGNACLYVRCQDVEQLNVAGRQNSKILLRVVCGTGVAGFEYPSVDATKGTRLTIPGAGVISVSARMVVANANVLVARATIRVIAAIAWGGTSRVPAVQTLPAFTLGVGVPSAFVRIPDQSRYHMAQTTNPGRSGALQADFATNNNAADIRYSQLAPDINTTLIHSGVEWVRYTGDAVQDVTPVFETH